MRELKFRCFYRGEMYEVKELSQGFVSSIEMNIDSEFRIVSPDSEHVKGIMQYTGLKDKNGAEIYEGDILSFLNENWQVIYFETYASFMLQKGNDLQNITTQEEVIGNIYQNPELLKL